MPFALVLTIVLALLALFQLALILGAPWGRLAWGGAHRILPARLRIGSAVSILVYVFMVLVAWTRVGVLHVFPDAFAVVTMWVIFAYACVGVLMNAVSRSRPERFTMTPVALVMAALSLPIALGMGVLALPV